MPTSGGGFAKATIVELRLISRMLVAFAGLGPGTAAVALATWSAHLLDLRRGGLDRNPDRCSHALQYLLIFHSNVNKFAGLPPRDFLAGEVHLQFMLCQQFSNNTPWWGGRDLRGKSAHICIKT